MHQLLLATLLAVPLPLVASGAHQAAQASPDRVAIRGRVIDATLAPIAGARVTAVTDQQTTGPLSALTDRRGEFSLIVSPARYTVRVVAEGFRDASRSVTASEASGDSWEFILQVAGIHEAVTVRVPGGYGVEESATATKTLTPLRDVPQTLNVLPRALLVDQNARSVADAVRTVPGVSVAQGEGNRDQLVLRGMSSASDFFVNGVRDDQERFRDLYNVQSLEVLQGPAAVLFGRGGAGGVVNLVTRKPVRGAPSDFSLELGSYDRKRGAAQLTAPLGAKAMLLLNAVGEDAEGFRDSYYLRRYGLNPTLGVDLGRATTLTIGFEHLYDRRLADRGIPSRAGAPVSVGPGQFFGSPQQNEAQTTVDSVSAALEHTFGRGVTLRNNFLVGRYDKYYRNVYPGSAVSVAGTLTLSAYDHTNDRTNVFNQTDLVVRGKTGRMAHVLLFGLEAGGQFQDDLRHTAANITGVPVSNSVRDANFETAVVAFDRHATSNIVGVYAQDQIELARRWKAVLGVRTDRFEVTVDNRPPGVADLSRTDVAASPRAGMIYQPNAMTSIYTSYAYTFLPSGQTLGLAINTVDLKPENARNYEVGAKLDLLGKRLNLSAAAFRLDRNNVRTTDPNDPSRLVQTGQQRTDGFSVSAAGTLLPVWKIYGGYANMNARITQDTSSGPAGRKVGLVPRNQFSLWSTFDVSRQWGGGGGVVSRSKTFASFTNDVVLPSHTRVDAVIYRRIGGYRIAFNVENLLNARYYPTAHSDNNISTGAPRNVQLSLTATF